MNIIAKRRCNKRLAPHHPLHWDPHHNHMRFSQEIVEASSCCNLKLLHQQLDLNRSWAVSEWRRLVPTVLQRLLVPSSAFLNWVGLIKIFDPCYSFSVLSPKAVSFSMFPAFLQALNQLEFNWNCYKWLAFRDRRLAQCEPTADVAYVWSLLWLLPKLDWWSLCM